MKNNKDHRNKCHHYGAGHEQSISFYENLGFEIKNRWDDHYAMLSTTGLTLGIHPAKEKTTGSGNVSIGLMVDDANEAKALLEKNNISFQYHDDKSGIYLNFKDPDGTVVYYTQPKWK